MGDDISGLTARELQSAWDDFTDRLFQAWFAEYSKLWGAIEARKFRDHISHGYGSDMLDSFMEWVEGSES
ncbi:hypothetical protein KHQ84_gp121 [Rhodococcus phage Finch]|uniref:Uncharacterized protein n=1 Tax=Rhodococcus phage Finch TaxID=2094144 RepID=A0A2P1JXK8_9CAUD|nr:hypothetical protein KHQ84_gp121 [Rhodococcus phage Finch]AVO25052.1 hypothetical protein SEA_FINCH_121 [Rhodococcus phage Finch]